MGKLTYKKKREGLVTYIIELHDFAGIYSEREPNQKLLIFIVAYHAEKHIESVLDRIPEQVRHSKNVHILCVDDASDDRSAGTGCGGGPKNTR